MRAPPSQTHTRARIELTSRAHTQAAAHEREASKLRAAVAAAEGALEVAAAKRADVLEEAAVEQVGGFWMPCVQCACSAVLRWW